MLTFFLSCCIPNNLSPKTEFIQNHTLSKIVLSIFFYSKLINDICSLHCFTSKGKTVLTLAGCQVCSCHHEAPCSPPPGPGWGPSHQPHVGPDSPLLQKRVGNNTPGPEKTRKTEHTPHTTVAPARNTGGEKKEKHWSTSGGENWGHTWGNNG